MQRKSILPHASLLCLCLCFSTPTSGAEPSVVIAEKTPSEQTASAFAGQIKPLLAKYCLDCHGGSKPKAGLDLKKAGDDGAILKDRKLWGRLVEYVESGEMPPEDREHPSDSEVERFAQAVQGILTQVDCGRDVDPGRVTIRRLNRAEYNNTIRDLVGIDFQPADDFPSDDVGYGFDNIADVLTLPPILFEKYLAAAEAIADQAIVVGTGSKGPNRVWDGEQLGRALGGKTFGEGGRLLASNGVVAVSYQFPGDGEYILRARVFGQQAGPDAVRLALRIDGMDVAAARVTAESTAPEVVEARVSLRKGQHTFAVAFLNDYYNPDESDPHRRDRNLVIESLAAQGPVVSGPENLPDSHKQIFFCTPTATTKNECARAIIERFASRAYRRQATAGEIGRLLRFVDLAEQNGDSFERGIQLAVEAILCSPQFLFRVELDPRPRRKGEQMPPVRQINEIELAARLSYFLWSSMPDEELLRLASEGQLRSGDNLERQVSRMIRDPKSRALVENFGDQWLHLRLLNAIHPDTKQFPTFDEELRRAMLEETRLFFESLIRDDRSVLDFLDSNETFLNARLARHYGIPGVSGDEFRRVRLPDDRRGGLLGQASILTVTSNPTRTSPVKRGKWILEQILGSPPPPPPPDVPELKDEPGAVLAGTLRQRMEQHRANPSCASCHARMDPLGFGLENYDAIGAWRDKEGAFPIDSSGTLPSGQSFQGPKALKAILRGRNQEFVHCLAEKMLTFALGRGLDYHDACAVDRIVAAMAGNENKFSTLILEIVRSDPFQKRRTK